MPEPIGDRKLTLKESKWLKAYYKHGNQTQAAKDAGYRGTSEESYANIGLQNFRKLESHILKWLNEYGLSEFALKNKLKELLECKEIKFFAHEGHVCDERVIEARETQRRTLDMALRVRGLYSPEKIEVKTTKEETIEEIEKDIERLERIVNNGSQDVKKNDEKRSPTTIKKKKKRTRRKKSSK